MEALPRLQYRPGFGPEGVEDIPEVQLVLTQGAVMGSMAAEVEVITLEI